MSTMHRQKQAFCHETNTQGQLICLQWLLFLLGMTPFQASIFLPSILAGESWFFTELFVSRLDEVLNGDRAFLFVPSRARMFFTEIEVCPSRMEKRQVYEERRFYKPRTHICKYCVHNVGFNFSCIYCAHTAYSHADLHVVYNQFYI